MMNSDKKIILAPITLALSLISLCAFADNAKVEAPRKNPAPFGIELMTTNCNAISKKLTVQQVLNQKDIGRIILIEPKTIKMQGLREIIFHCDNDNMVDMAIITLYKDRFDSSYKNLSEKYKINKEKIPFVGEKFVEFQAGDSIIQLEAPHMSFDTTIVYKNTKTQKHKNTKTQK